MLMAHYKLTIIIIIITIIITIITIIIINIQKWWKLFKIALASNF